MPARAFLAAFTATPFPTGALTPDQTQVYQNLARTGAVTRWDLPEERRYWVPGEMRILEAYTKLIRSVPQPLPTYMYIPSNYGAEGVSPYLPYIDIVPASVYPGYANQPYAWSRWRMETTVKGILDGGAVIGKDYRAGQKTPVAILELFYDPAEKGHLPSAVGAYHDFWQVLVSGAQGILIYSYYYRNDDPNLEAVWASLQQAMGELLGPERLDRVLLWGTPVPGIHASVITGTTSTPTFAPNTTPSVIATSGPIGPSQTATRVLGPGAAPTASWWKPALVTPWQWQLSQPPVDQSFDVAMYDIDLFDNEAGVVAALHAQGRKVVC